MKTIFMNGFLLNEISSIASIFYYKNAVPIFSSQKQFGQNGPSGSETFGSHVHEVKPISGEGDGFFFVENRQINICSSIEIRKYIKLNENHWK